MTHFGRDISVGMCQDVGMTNQIHCSNCGTDDYEDVVACADEGYTACCNEPACHCSPTDRRSDRCRPRQGD